MDRFEVVAVQEADGTRWVIRWTPGKLAPRCITGDFKTREEAQRWADRLASLQ